MQAMNEYILRQGSNECHFNNCYTFNTISTLCDNNIRMSWSFKNMFLKVYKYVFV